MERVSINKIIDVKRSIKFFERFKYQKLVSSIKKYGQLKNIVVDLNYNIIDGHLIYRALKQLEIEEVWIRRVETQTPYLLYVELNLLVFDINPVQLIKYMEKSSLENNCIPHSEKDIQGLLKLLHWDWNIYKKKNIKKGLG
jgi:hypothetical protein